MKTRAHLAKRRLPVTSVGQFGLAAWFFGNLYEGAVGVPQLLVDARSNRSPGVLTVGSPVRYFAPVAPVALSATAATLLRAWRSTPDRRLVAATAGSIGAALALSGYLIRKVNVPLLENTASVTEAELRQSIATWHKVNAARLVLLGAGIAGQARLTRRHR